TDRSAPAPRPPRSWQIRTAAVLVALGASVLISLVGLALDLLNWHFWSSGGHGDQPALVTAVVRFYLAYGLVVLVVVVAYIGTFSGWHKATSRVLQAVTGRPAAGAHWTVIIWRVSFFFCLYACGSPGNLVAVSTVLPPQQARGMGTLMGAWAAM